MAERKIVVTLCATRERIVTARTAERAAEAIRMALKEIGVDAPGVYVASVRTSRGT